jgi:hypothetical protein
MDALQRSDFMQHFKGRIFLSQFEAFTALSLPEERNLAKLASGHHRPSS